tara:strand:- start:111 stop:380 length:270 start_codon:yes stop_codon:yes gene_type:complete
MSGDGLKKRKDGSYILKHKTKEARLKGDCIECGQNPSSRELLLRHNTEDMMLVRNHIEDHLTSHPKHKAVTPRWCSKCNALIKYIVRIV